MWKVGLEKEFKHHTFKINTFPGSGTKPYWSHLALFSLSLLAVPVIEFSV